MGMAQLQQAWTKLLDALTAILEPSEPSSLSASDRSAQQVLTV